MEKREQKPKKNASYWSYVSVNQRVARAMTSEGRAWSWDRNGTETGQLWTRYIALASVSCLRIHVYYKYQ